MKDIITPSFGPTECEILQILWDNRPLTVRQVQARLTARRPLSYTTLLTTSQRMEDKGLIVRTAADWRQISPLTLTPALSRVELLAHTVARICADLEANSEVLDALEWAEG